MMNSVLRCKSLNMHGLLFTRSSGPRSTFDDYAGTSFTSQQVGWKKMAPSASLELILLFFIFKFIFSSILAF